MTTEQSIEMINQIARDLEKLRQELGTYKEELAPIKEELAEIHEKKAAAKQVYLDTVAKIIEREEKLTVERNTRNNLMRKLQQSIDSTERQLQQAMRIKQLEEEAARLDKQLEETMTLAKWFSKIMTHQFEAAKKITLYRRLILADAPGLGKTLTALATADLIKSATASARPDNPYGYDPINRVKGVPYPCGHKILYVCPAPLLHNVLREVALWTDRSPVLLGAQPKATRRFLIDTLNAMKDDYIVIVNYEAWRRDKQLLSDLKTLQFDFVILDEAHVLKERNTQAYLSVKSLLAHHESVVIDMPEYNDEQGWGWTKASDNYVPFVLAMTGTPILNKPQDLFALLSLVDPDHFNNEYWFLQDYCQQDSWTGKWGFRTGGLESLAKRVSNLYLRRTKKDAGIVLPGKHEELHELEFDKENYPWQYKAYREMKQYGAVLVSAEKTISAAAVIAIYTRLRQIMTWPAGIEVKNEDGVVMLRLDVEESQKLDYIIDRQGNGLLADLTEGGLEEGSSVVVFSQFKAPLQELHRRLDSAGISSVVLDGDTPQSLRDEIILDFDRRHTTDANAKWQVVLANYRVGGVGVTLTRATEMILLDSEWSAGREEQATDRVHRIGQTEDVTIHKITVKGTIDDWLDGLVKSKRNLTQGFDDAIDFEALKQGLLED